MPHRSRDTVGKFLPNTPKPSNIQPSLFFGDCQLPSLTTGELEKPLGEKPENFEEPIREEAAISPTQIIAKNRQNEFFPIQETNGEARIKNINPDSLPYFHGLTFEELDTFMFEFFVFCRTYDYTFDEQKVKLFPSTLEDETLH